MEGPRGDTPSTPSQDGRFPLQRPPPPGRQGPRARAQPSPTRTAQPRQAGPEPGLTNTPPGCVAADTTPHPPPLPPAPRPQPAPRTPLRPPRAPRFRPGSGARLPSLPGARPFRAAQSARPSPLRWLRRPSLGCERGEAGVRSGEQVRGRGRGTRV